MNTKVIFWPESTKNKEKIFKEINYAYKLVFSFFEQEIPEMDINIVSDRKQFNLFNERETRDWEVGYTFFKNDKVVIAIFNSESFEKYSTHKKEEFNAILIHELTHVFTGYVLKFFYPKWLHEGLAGYVAEQYKGKIIKKENITELSELHSLEGWNKNNKYLESFLFTKFLFDQFGKEKMLDFMKNLGWKTEFKDFETKFKKQFKKSLENLFIKWKNF